MVGVTCLVVKVTCIVVKVTCIAGAAPGRWVSRRSFSASAEARLSVWEEEDKWRRESLEEGRGRRDRLEE